MQQALSTDPAAIREQARERLRDGAVTPAYGADPAEVVEVLNQVLATEIVCQLRYRQHYYAAGECVADNIAAELMEHAQQEQRHADRVATRITQLGGVPNFDPDTLTARSHAAYQPGDGVAQMVRINLEAERVAIAMYSEIVRWLGDRDPTTRRLMEEILQEEEEHAGDMLTLLRHLER